MFDTEETAGPRAILARMAPHLLADMAGVVALVVLLVVSLHLPALA